MSLQVEYIAVYEPKVYFGISIADWIQICILLVALLAFFYPRFTSSRNNDARKEALRSALLQEMLQNMHGLFNGGIERPFLFKVFESFLSNESKSIKDESKFQELISLYVDLMDFRKITDQFWPPITDPTFSNLECTQKQIETINSFLQYFDEDRIEFERTNKSMVEARETAKKVRNENQEKWHKMLKENIENIM